MTWCSVSSPTRLSTQCLVQDSRMAWCVLLLVHVILFTGHINTVDGRDNFNKGTKISELSIPRNEYKRVCYYTNWSQYRRDGAKFFPKDIDPFLCTHLIFAFAKIQNGVLEPYEWNDLQHPFLYKQFTGLKKQNPRLKTLLAVGGWTHGSQPFTAMVATKSSRSKFIKHAIQYLRTHDFDGLDLDWEYPANRGSPSYDKQRLSLLVKELHEAFEAESKSTGQGRLLLSMAVPGGPRIVKSGYEVRKLDKYLDFFNLMSYDLHGTWSTKVGHHAPLYGGEQWLDSSADSYTVNGAVNLWLDLGASRQKLVLGLPIYGKAFKLCGKDAQPGQRSCGAPHPDVLPYYEIAKRLRSGQMTPSWLPEEQIPYGHDPSNRLWVGYDNEKSLRSKVQYAMSEGLGGVMAWSIDEDDFNGQFGRTGVKYPLLSAVKEAILLGEKGKQPEQKLDKLGKLKVKQQLAQDNERTISKPTKKLNSLQEKKALLRKEALELDAKRPKAVPLRSNLINVPPRSDATPQMNARRTQNRGRNGGKFRPTSQRTSRTYGSRPISNTAPNLAARKGRRRFSKIRATNTGKASPFQSRTPTGTTSPATIRRQNEAAKRQTRSEQDRRTKSATTQRMQAMERGSIPNGAKNSATQARPSSTSSKQNQIQGKRPGIKILLKRGKRRRGSTARKMVSGKPVVAQKQSSSIPKNRVSNSPYDGKSSLIHAKPVTERQQIQVPTSVSVKRTQPSKTTPGQNFNQINRKKKGSRRRRPVSNVSRTSGPQVKSQTPYSSTNERMSKTTQAGRSVSPFTKTGTSPRHQVSRSRSHAENEVDSRRQKISSLKKAKKTTIVSPFLQKKLVSSRSYPGGKLTTKTYDQNRRSRHPTTSHQGKFRQAPRPLVKSSPYSNKPKRGKEESVERRQNLEQTRAQQARTTDLQKAVTEQNRVLTSPLSGSDTLSRTTEAKTVDEKTHILKESSENNKPVQGTGRQEESPHNNNKKSTSPLNREEESGRNSGNHLRQNSLQSRSMEPGTPLSQSSPKQSQDTTQNSRGTNFRATSPGKSNHEFSPSPSHSNTQREKMTTEQAEKSTAKNSRNETTPMSQSKQTLANNNNTATTEHSGNTDSEPPKTKLDQHATRPEEMDQTQQTERATTSKNGPDGANSDFSETNSTVSQQPKADVTVNAKGLWWKPDDAETEEKRKVDTVRRGQSLGHQMYPYSGRREDRVVTSPAEEDKTKNLTQDSQQSDDSKDRRVDHKTANKQQTVGHETMTDSKASKPKSDRDALNNKLPGDTNVIQASSDGILGPAKGSPRNKPFKRPRSQAYRSRLISLSPYKPQTSQFHPVHKVEIMRTVRPEVVYFPERSVDEWLAQTSSELSRSDEIDEKQAREMQRLLQNETIVSEIKTMLGELQHSYSPGTEPYNAISPLLHHSTKWYNREAEEPQILEDRSHREFYSQPAVRSKSRDSGRKRIKAHQGKTGNIWWERSKETIREKTDLGHNKPQSDESNRALRRGMRKGVVRDTNREHSMRTGDLSEIAGTNAQRDRSNRHIVHTTAAKTTKTPSISSEMSGTGKDRIQDQPQWQRHEPSKYTVAPTKSSRPDTPRNFNQRRKGSIVLDANRHQSRESKPDLWWEMSTPGKIASVSEKASSVVSSERKEQKSAQVEHVQDQRGAMSHERSRQLNRENMKVESKSNIGSRIHGTTEVSKNQIESQIEEQESRTDYNSALAAIKANRILDYIDADKYIAFKESQSRDVRPKMKVPKRGTSKKNAESENVKWFDKISAETDGFDNMKEDNEGREDQATDQSNGRFVSSERSGVNGRRKSESTSASARKWSKPDADTYQSEADWLKTPLKNLKTTSVLVRLPGGNKIPENSYAIDNEEPKLGEDANLFLCPSTFGIYSDPYDCRKFYQCVWFVAFHHVCGFGTQWNHEDRTCDWPTNTDCVKRTNR